MATATSFNFTAKQNAAIAHEVALHRATIEALVNDGKMTEGNLDDLETALSVLQWSLEEIFCFSPDGEVEWVLDNLEQF